MNILIDIAHPAHVHLLRNTIDDLRSRGNKVIVTVKDIPSAISLLDRFQIPYIYTGGKSDSLVGKSFLQLIQYFKILGIVLKEKIDLGFSSSITVAHVSIFTKMKCVILDDDDDVVEPLFVRYAHPFANAVLSPDCVQRAIKTAIKYPGYHELAYLHPKRFVPDEKVLDEAGVSLGETFFVLRFNSFKAHHDVGVRGLSNEDKLKLISKLSTKGKVFITTERKIDAEFEPYQLKVSPEKIHSLLYYATLFISDSQTMTTEASILGTPSIRCNSFVGMLSVFEELEHTYGLTFGFKPENSESMFEKIDALLKQEDLKTEFHNRKKVLLSDKIDVTAFFLWFIDNFPESINIALQGKLDYDRFR